MSKPVAIVLALSALSLAPVGPRADVESSGLRSIASQGDPTQPTRPRAVSVTGRVVVRPQAADPPPAMSPYARRRSVPPQDPGTAGGAEDAFVYFEPTDGSTRPSEASPARVGQRDRTIVPHVSAVHVGQLVEFPNDDDVFHNIFSLSSGNHFSLGRYAPGTTESNVFDQPGVVRLFCDIHAEMAGVILVVETPYLARVQPDGAYLLSDVPSGSYRAVAWHPSAGADTVMISVTGGADQTVDFVLDGGS